MSNLKEVKFIKGILPIHPLYEDDKEANNSPGTSNTKKYTRLALYSPIFTNTQFGVNTVASTVRTLMYQRIMKYRKKYWFMSNHTFTQYSKARVLNKNINYYLDNLSWKKIKVIDLRLLTNRTIRLIQQKYSWYNFSSIVRSRRSVLYKALKYTNRHGQIYSKKLYGTYDESITLKNKYITTKRSYLAVIENPTLFIESVSFFNKNNENINHKIVNEELNVSDEEILDI